MGIQIFWAQLQGAFEATLSRGLLAQGFVGQAKIEVVVRLIGLEPECLLD